MLEKRFHFIFHVNDNDKVDVNVYVNANVIAIVNVEVNVYVNVTFNVKVLLLVSMLKSMLMLIVMLKIMLMLYLSHMNDDVRMSWPASDGEVLEFQNSLVNVKRTAHFGGSEVIGI